MFGSGCDTIVARIRQYGRTQTKSKHALYRAVGTQAIFAVHGTVQLEHVACAMNLYQSTSRPFCVASFFLCSKYRKQREVN